MNLESEAFEMFVHEMLLVSRHSCGPGFHFTKEAENITAEYFPECAGFWDTRNKGGLTP